MVSSQGYFVLFTWFQGELFWSRMTSRSRAAVETVLASGLFFKPNIGLGGGGVKVSRT